MKFEYKVELTLLNEDQLNELGEKGWELVSYNRNLLSVKPEQGYSGIVNRTDYAHSYVFKRLIPDEVQLP